MNENLDESKKLIDNKKIKFDNIKKDQFIQDLLEQCINNNILNKDEVDYINFAISKILNEKLIYFTKNESSSINIDIAESILQSVYFTISMALKKTGNIDEIISKLKYSSVNSIFISGEKIIKQMFIKSRTTLEKVKSNRLKIDNYSYIDTIDYGIDIFFKKYDYFFKAHIVPGDIDYQLSNDVFSYTGIEHIDKYIKYLNYENIFCGMFDINEIKSLLYSYDDNSNELLLNVFDIVLTNSIGSYIVGKDLLELNIKEYEKEVIQDKLSCNYDSKNLSIYLREYLEEIIKRLNIESDEFIIYIQESINRIKENLIYYINNGKIETQFVTFKEKYKKALVYKPYPKLSNIQLKKLYEEVLRSNSTAYKINLIKEKVKNIEDITDLLSSECFAQYEYISFFKSLDYFTISLIIAYLPYSIEEENSYDKIWYREFRKYYISLQDKTRNKIEELSKQIKF